MNYRTQFNGYTPESDLAAADWVKRLSGNALATVQGISLVRVASNSISSSLTTFTFSSVISEAGRYIVTAMGAGATSGIASVLVGGVSADEVVQQADGLIGQGLFIADVQSFGSGDIEVEFNSGPQNVCVINVWKVLGLSSNTAHDSLSGALGAYDLLDVLSKSVIAGQSASIGDDVDHFWKALNNWETEDLSGDTVFLSADLIRLFEETNIEVGAATGDNDLDGGWVAGSWSSPVDFFPSGQAALFEKNTGDANTFWSWNAFSPAPDVEVLALVRPISDSDDMNMGIAGRMRGASGAEDSYSFLLHQSSAGARDQVILAKTDGSSTLTLIGSESSFNWSLDNNYWMKLRISGTTLRAKIWAEDDDEPAAWNLEETDTSISASGYVGIWHEFIGSSFMVGQFNAKTIFPEWPDDVPDNWAVNMSGGPQPNQEEFNPEVGPTISRRRASTVTTIYRVEVPGLNLTELTAFKNFYHKTLIQGTVPFTKLDPFTALTKTWKFMRGEQAYQEETMRPVDADYTSGLYKVTFQVMKLD